MESWGKMRNVVGGQKDLYWEGDERKKVGPEGEINWLGVIGGKNRLTGDRRSWEVKEGMKGGGPGVINTACSP